MRRLDSTRLFLLLLLLPATTQARADAPSLASWLLNSTGLTGYGGLPANVQLVRFSSGSVYVSSSGIPSYTIGPTWGNDPNLPANQSFVFKIPRTPALNGGALTATPLGPIGVWANGVALFNAKDAMSYNNQNVWHQNAVVVENGDFDACLGHPAPGGVYHHHQNPRCLYQVDERRHSPILGYAFDGFPIYGPYGYANTNGTGGIARMRSSYRARNITTRTTYANGTPVTAGPPVSGTFPLGYYIEDFEYVFGLGDLDDCNGRFTVTPEYPAGIYAYFATVDESGASAYPYSLGATYRGVVAQENITQHGHVTVSEPVTTYTASGPGLVPESVVARRISDTTIALSWNVSCTPAGAPDYGIYEGQIGAWYSHTALACQDTGHDLQETVTTSAGSRYYLVVPLGPTDEGDYGEASNGTPIPAGGPAFCRGTRVAASCP